jgi:hypothetical protein
VAAGEHVDIGKVTLAGRFVAAVDRGHDLLGEHGLQRVADNGERLCEQRWVADLHGRRRHRVPHVDVDAKRVPGAIDADRHGDADTGVWVGLSDDLRTQARPVVILI